MHQNGLGVQHNVDEASRWYIIGSEQAAQYKKRQEYAITAHWYRKAADQGFEFAHFQVGVWIQSGRGVGRNLPEAPEHLTVAAKDLPAEMRARNEAE